MQIAHALLPLCTIQRSVSLPGQINDLADKLEMWDTSPGRSSLLMQEATASTASTDRKTEDKLVKATKVRRIACPTRHIVSLVAKI